MIIDKLCNIAKYPQIPDYVVNFVKNLSTNSEDKRYELLGENYANIEKYFTKNIEQARFESHDVYIDIQFLLKGKERIYLKSRDNLKIQLPYNIEKDITFYSDDISTADYITLDSQNFVLIYPHEAHAPQVSVDTNLQQKVKKVVVKLKK